ncbi:MAG: hypothetical protein LBV28_03705 [Puniceicoccales bacterium]|nr:hypothetical protein [Puniceicoccales bacterium]
MRPPPPARKHGLWVKALANVPPAAKMQGMEFANDTLRALRPFCHYIWWKTPEEALAFPVLLVAQVMNIGTFEDTS